MGSTVMTIVQLVIVGVLMQSVVSLPCVNNADKERMKNLFKSASPFADLESLHYAVEGLTYLNAHIEEHQKVCDFIKQNAKTTDLEQLFYASSASKTLKNKHNIDCRISWGDADKTASAGIADDAGSQTLYHAVSVLTNLGKSVDSPSVIAALDAAMKADDSPTSWGFAFLTASLLEGDVSKQHSMIEDIIPQADEVDGKYLHYSAGLQTTCTVINGIYKLSQTAKRSPPLKDEEVQKFANFLLSRKHTITLQNAASVLMTLHTLTDNPYHIPITVSLASQKAVSTSSPLVKVQVANLMCASLGKLIVTADAATRITDDSVVMSNKPFSQSSSDPTMFEIDFMNMQPSKGFYKVAITVTPDVKEKRLVGLYGSEIEVKVTAMLAVENVEISVVDREQSSSSKMQKVHWPSKLATALHGDSHQKILMKSQFVEQQTKQVFLVHQAFVKLTNQKNKQEIIFVAEADSNNFYKFELDIGNKAKEFGSASGKYSIEMVVGDAVLENPLQWTVADIDLDFQGTDEVAAPKTKDLYAKKDEIKHLFREPEPLPPTIISSLFTILVIVPIVIMIVLWLGLGINVSNVPFSVSSLGFHLGLGMIFGLYFCYWWTLNMFTTLRWLGILGIPTFLSGNRLLRHLAAKKKDIAPGK